MQGGHLRGDQPFAGRVLLEHRCQVGGHPLVQTHAELRLCPLFHGRQPQFTEPAVEACAQPVVGDIREQRAVPEGEGTVVEAGPLRRIPGVGRLPDERGELLRVDPVRPCSTA